MSKFELAQLNIAHLKAPIESPLLADFVANLDRINALAEASDGFKWRLMTDDGNATSLRPFGDDVIVNMSVWRDLEALRNYVHHSAHVEIMERRREWFARASEAYAVLWWVAVGHRPSVSEAAGRLENLRRYGSSPAAFTFGKAVPAPDAAHLNEHFTTGECPAS
jgi:heme-degrading monooxygenase HmoA